MTWHLTQSLGFRARHLRWIPHLLSHSQKLDRVTLLQQLLSVLERQERRSWHDMVILDESWFYLNADHELIWLQRDEEVSERERCTVQSEKVMTTIVWNPSGFHLIKLRPKVFKHNANYYITQIFNPLSVWHGTHIRRTNRKLIARADKARPHTAQVTLDFMEPNAMKRAPHPHPF
jgi:hypothetical protein